MTQIEQGVGETRRGLSWPRLPARFQRVPAALWGVAFIVLASLVLTARLPLDQQVSLQVGDVSPRDIRSPRQISFESAVLTERAREQAARSVPDIYDPPQARIRREQVARAKEVLDYITSIRQDEYASQEQKIAWINAIPDVVLSREIAEEILELSEDSWNRIVDEVPAVLDRVMREEIREGQVAQHQQRVPSMISLSLSDEEAIVAAEIVRTLIRPNSFFNAERTQAEREAARERVPPQMRTIERGEIILRAGDVVTAADMEALEALGLQAHAVRDRAAQSVLLVVVVAILIGVYLYWLAPEFWHHRRWPPLLVTLMVIFLAAARWMIPDQPLLAYIYPLPAMAMLIAALLTPNLAAMATVGVALLAVSLSDRPGNLFPYLLVGSLVSAFVLRRAERVSTFVWAGISIAAIDGAVLLSAHLTEGPVTSTDMARFFALGVVHGGLSASIALISLYLLGSVFGVTTSLQLMELSRPTHPLLRQLLLKAPGTYHHTILVSNLGERAAQAIGADPLLTRVGAYYHDIGKTLRPYFFVDNQADGVNPHDQIDPQTSAQIIISHVKDGLDLARRHRLPPRLRDFIPEHHGTTLVSYFYHQAVKQAGSKDAVDEAQFRYPGPRPRSKETAIIMLADSCESAVRAAQPASREEIDQIVRKIIQQRLLDGELDESDLTLRDLDLIRQAFVRTLQGVHHPRIRYPEAVETPPEGERGRREPAHEAQADARSASSGG
ncbi:MAG: HDIG domain-containing protein [Anaerolineae bacterium]